MGGLRKGEAVLPGAQTERQGGAEPVRALLGGENAPAALLQSQVVEKVKQDTGR